MSRAAFRTVRRNYAIAGVVVTIAGLALWLSGSVGGLIAALGGTLAVLSIITPILDRLLIPRNPIARVGQHCEYLIDESGIHFDISGISGSIAWPALTEVREDRGVVVMFQGKVPLGGLPTRLFSDAQPLELFRRWVSERAPTARVVRRD